MSVWIKAAACAGLLALASSASAQSVYKWKDASGKWVFGDRPPASAPAQAVSLRPGPKLGPAGVQDTLENAKAAKLFPIVLYANKCGQGCDLALALLKERGVPFALKDPSVAEHFEAFKKASPETLAPAMTVGDKALSPFNDLAWIAALDEAGYSPAPKKKAGEAAAKAPAPALSPAVSAPAAAPVAPAAPAAVPAMAAAVAPAVNNAVGK